MEGDEHLKKSPAIAKDVLHLTEALYVSIKRDSAIAAKKYLQSAKDLGILRQVVICLVMCSVKCL